MKDKFEKARIIDLVSAECQRIIDKLYSEDQCKPYFMLSMIHQREYLFTLIHGDKEQAIDYRQSEIITLDTNLEETIQDLYARTM